jgi:hypothetical protein
MATNGVSERLRQPAECAITVDGEPITALYPYLRDAQVSMSRRAASTATLTFDTVRFEDGQWSVQDAGVLERWKFIVIEAVFGDRHEEIMRGYIKEVSCEYPEDMSATRVVVVAQDESLLLDREHLQDAPSAEKQPRSDGEIVSRIAKDHDLGVSVQQGLTNASLNFNGTQIRLLRERAEANGYELYVRKKVLHFHPPELDQTPVEPIRLYAGRATNCLRFAVKYDAHKPDEVAVTRAAESGSVAEETRLRPNLTPLGKDPANSEGLGLLPFVWRMQSARGATAAEAQSRAQAAANDNSWKISAEGELDGALYGHVLLTHQLVPVDGAGPTHSGLYYVDEVQHKFSLDGYRLAFKLIRNATGEQAMDGPADVLASVL